MSARRLSTAAAVVFLLAGGSARAGGARTWKQTSAKDFEEGEPTAAVILPTGEVTTGLTTTRLPVEAAFVWCAAMSRDGATAYFGTGDEGRLYALDVKDGAVPRKLADLDAAWITSLAVRPDGTLLAGTTPGGRIFAVDPRGGAVRELARLPADQVWALAHDAASGTTYAGAGPGGKVYAVDAKGGVKTLWDSGDKHVVALALEADGALLAGTSDEAILYRLRDGRPGALHDFDAEEVRAIVPGKGAIFVAVNDFDKAGGAPAGAGPAPARGTKITVTAGGGAPASAGALPRPGARKAKAGIYRLEPDGRIEQVFSLTDGYLTSLLADDGGTVWAGSGSQGRVFRVAPDRAASLVVDLPERQALALLAASPDGPGGKAGLLVGAGDGGAVFRARPAAAGGSYLGKVLDAESTARFGMLRWHGSKGLAFETRSGNTAKPDTAWSDWRPLDRATGGGDGGAGRVASRGARYLQYRVQLAPGAVLRDVTTHYLPQNQRARITEMTDGSEAPPAGSGSTRSHAPVAKLRWKVENPDGDELIYRLSFKADGETVWRPLGGPDPLGKPEYDWNTDSVPDGLYVVRVVASDERANPRERALDFTYVSAPVLVDNRKPEVLGLEARGAAVAGRARDEASTITQIEFQIDGGDWEPAAPDDGILDDRVEPFSLRLPPSLAPGPHVVTVRAWDAADNVGAAQVVVRLPP